MRSFGNERSQPDQEEDWRGIYKDHCWQWVSVRRIGDRGRGGCSGIGVTGLCLFSNVIDRNVIIVYSVYIRTAQSKREENGFVKILISNTSDSPLYQQIKDQIKDAILKEELTEGDALPSIRAFANDLKVSVLTIRRVYEELEQEGFVTSQVGIGTFVSAGNLELLRDSKRRLVEQKMLDMIQTAKSLKISKEELNSMMDILYEED